MSFLSKLYIGHRDLDEISFLQPSPNVPSRPFSTSNFPVTLARQLRASIALSSPKMLATTIGLYVPSILLAASIVHAHGITVINNLSKNLFLWSVADGVAPMHTLYASGGNYHEDWRMNPKGGAISIKVAFTPSMDDILQFEYSLGEKVSWDLSSINMKKDSLFRKVGFSSWPSDTAGCAAAICPPNGTICKDSFEQVSDNQVIRMCRSDINIITYVG
jgi:hypothetical protein